MAAGTDWARARFDKARTERMKADQRVMPRLCGDFDIADRRLRFGNCFADFTHRLAMGSQCVLKVASCLFRSVAGRYASRNVGRVGGIAGPCLLDDYGITSHAHFRLAFLSIAFNVPVASSFPSFPGTVTIAASFGCLNWRWPPLERISIHPFSSNRRITSRTFIGMLGNNTQLHGG